jgi:FkbM family methyltransferase
MIYSFEPLTDCYEQLAMTMAGVPRFSAFNFALSDSNGKSQIYRNDFVPSSSLLPMGRLHVEAFPYTRNARLEEIEI